MKPVTRDRSTREMSLRWARGGLPRGALIVTRKLSGRPFRTDNAQLTTDNHKQELE
jgi:hypothetical protein